MTTYHCLQHVCEKRCSLPDDRVGSLMFTSESRYENLWDWSKNVGNNDGSGFSDV